MLTATEIRMRALEYQQRRLRARNQVRYRMAINNSLCDVLTRIKIQVRFNQRLRMHLELEFNQRINRQRVKDYFARLNAAGVGIDMELPAHTKFLRDLFRRNIAI